MKEQKKATIRPLTTVGFAIEYVVYADDPEMIHEAKICILEDLCNAYKFGEESQYIDVTKTGRESEDRISSFLSEKSGCFWDEEEDGEEE